ncbi:MAG TPA: glycosyltransferase, partial [bacterium]
MRILLVDPTLVYPGEGAKLTAFKAIPGVTLEALSGERHRDEARQAQMPRMAQWHGIPLHLGKIIGKFPNRTWMLGGLRDCLKKQPDVILAYSDWNHWLTLQIAIAKTLISPRSKLIFQAWENQPPTWRRHPQPNSALYVLDSVVEKVVFRLADGAAARNAEAQRVLVRRGFRKPIRLIPWGVDMGFFHPREPEHTEEFTVGYVGRLVREKGVADLLMALQGLEGVKALIIGGGPEAKKLRELADQRDI